MSNKPNGTQCKRLLDWLNTGTPCTPLDSWAHLGIYRLSARVYDLKKRGYDVKVRNRKVKNQYGEECTVAEYYAESWPMEVKQ